MKKLLLVISLIFFAATTAYAELSNVGMTVISNDKNLFGLQDSQGNVTVEPQYKKLIRLGKSSWIVQKRNKYGIIDSCGNVLIEPKYRHVDRILTKYVKLGNDINFGIYDEKGDAILPPEYSSINLLFGGMFLTCKNYKYGVTDMKGKILLENKFDDIYMPKPNIMRLKYNGTWYEIEQVAGKRFTIPEDVQNIENNGDFRAASFINSPVAASGYSAVTFTDYILKLFASISPAHEETIDE
ncbi:WG repeat-containing protein, partial [bacterium]|nr:WG repeat-containing protein [bacterium]